MKILRHCAICGRGISHKYELCKYCHQTWHPHLNEAWLNALVTIELEDLRYRLKYPTRPITKETEKVKW